MYSGQGFVSARVSNLWLMSIPWGTAVSWRFTRYTSTVAFSSAFSTSHSSASSRGIEAKPTAPMPAYIAVVTSKRAITGRDGWVPLAQVTQRVRHQQRQQREGREEVVDPEVVPLGEHPDIEDEHDEHERD